MTERSDPVRLGVVGLGGMGQRHAGNAREAGHVVAGGADPIEDSRTAFADAFEVPVHADYEALYEEEEIDAVAIATPNTFHAPAAIAAFERDIAVLVEKPLADDINAARDVANAARESDAIGMVGFQNRFSASLEMLEAYRDAGALGEIVHVEAEYVRRRGIPNVDSWFTDASMAGGGALIDIGVHTIDFALAAADFPEPSLVSGVTRQLYADREDYVDPEDWSGFGSMGGGNVDVEDGASAFVRCEDGATLSLEVAWARDREPSRTVRIQGTEGGATCRIGEDELTIYGTSAAGTDHYVDSTMTDPNPPSSYAAEMQYFLARVAEGTPPATNTVEQGLTVQEIIHGIYRSNETGEPYRVGSD